MTENFDLIISGASVASCYLALAAASSGKTVAITDLHEFPGFDMTGTSELFFETGSAKHRLSDALNIPYEVFTKEAVASEGEVKKALAVALKNAGVKVFYMTVPVAVEKKSGEYLVLLAAKSEMLTLKCAELIDAGVTPIFGQLLSGKWPEISEKQEISVVTVCGGVENREKRFLPKVDGISAELHPVAMGKRVYVKLKFTVDGLTDCVSYRSKIIEQGVNAVLRYFEQIKKQPEFEKISVVSIGYDFVEPQLTLASNEVKRLSLECDISEIENIVKALKSVNGDRAECVPEITVLSEISGKVAVAGMGTGGISAVMGLLDGGVTPIVTDIKPLPGGIHTLGMVTGFWHGYQKGFAAKNVSDRDAFYLENYPNIKISVGISEAIYQFKRIIDGKATVLPCSLSFNPIFDGKRVKGFFAATEFGVIKINTDYTVDGTGEGDLAAAVGVPFTFGSARDGMTQSFSMWGQHPDPAPSFFNMRYRGDFDVFRPHSYSDYLRALSIAQANNSPYTVSPMLSYRETRHIRAEYTLNLEDILRDTLFDDTLTVASCPFDSHGLNESELEPCGFLNAAHPRHLAVLGSPKDDERPEDCELKIRIPLRCFLPKSVGRLAVVGRALGATRDAANLVRMVADIENCGYSVGFAVSLAVKNNCELGEVKAEAYKKHLTEIGSLPDWAFEGVWDMSIESLVQKTVEGDTMALLRLTALEREAVVPVLKQYDTERYPIILTLLAWFGDGDAVDGMIEMARSVENTDMWQLGYAVALLGRIGAENKPLRGKIAKYLCEAAESYESGGEYADPDENPYYYSRVDCRRFKNNKTILSFCYAAERIKDRALGEKLLWLNEKWLGKSYCTTDGDLKPCFMSHIQLRLLAAAVSCGCEEACPMLAEYLNDTREIFRDFARQELSTAEIPQVE